ncbi:WD40 repeat domain-containing protein [bacterium]|nr:WD40 repeat domain-containing protein [bacterium]
MSRDRSLIQRRLPSVLAGLLVAVSCGPGQAAALPAPPPPVAWPAENPYPEASARRQARLAQLRDPSNDEIASLALRHLEEVTSSLYVGRRLDDLSLGAFRAGDVDTALALVEAIVPASGGWWFPYSRLGGKAKSDGELDALLALLHDLPAVARGGEAAYALSGLVDSMAAAGRLPELDPFALSLPGGEHTPYLLSKMAIAYERQGEMEKARLFAAGAAREYAIQAEADPTLLLLPRALGVANVRMLLRLGLDEEGMRMLRLAHDLLLRHEGKPDALGSILVSDERARLEAFGVLFFLYSLAGLEQEGKALLKLAAGCDSGWEGFVCKVGLKFGIMDNDLAQEYGQALARGRALRGDFPGAEKMLRNLTGDEWALGTFELGFAQLRAGGAAAEEGLKRLLTLAEAQAAPTDPRLREGYWRTIMAYSDMLRDLIEGGFAGAAFQMVAAPADAEALFWDSASVAYQLLEAGDYGQAFAQLPAMEGKVLAMALSAVANEMALNPTGWEVEDIKAAGLLAANLPPDELRTSSLLNVGIALARTDHVEEAREYLATAQESGTDIADDRGLRQRSAALLGLLGREDEAVRLLLADIQPDLAKQQTPTKELIWLAESLLLAGLAPTRDAEDQALALAATAQPRCGSWQRVDSRVEALRICDLGRTEDLINLASAKFVSNDLIAIASDAGGVALWDIAGDPFVARRLPALGEIDSLAVHGPTGRLAAANLDGLFAIADLAKGEWLLVEELELGVQDLRYAADGLLVIAQEGGRTSAVRPGQLAMELLMEGSSWGEGSSKIAISPTDATIFVATRGERLRVVDLRSNPTGRPPRHYRGEVWDVGLLPTGERLLTAEGAEGVKLRDAVTLAEIRAFDADVEPYRLEVRPVGREFATVADQELQLWRLDGEEPHFRSQLTAGVSITGLSYSPDGQTLFAGGRHGAAHFLAPSGETFAGPLPGHDSWLEIGGWSPDSRSIATSDYRGGVIVWRLLDPATLDTPATTTGQ